jgi:hypothetical protein
MMPLNALITNLIDEDWERFLKIHNLPDIIPFSNFNHCPFNVEDSKVFAFKEKMHHGPGQ